MIWFFENPARSRWEREALEQLASQVSWMSLIRLRIDESLRLVWDIDMAVGDRIYPVSLRYPNHFPFSPPVVLPRSDSEQWSSHQYGPGGELCLEYGPDNWQPDITGADMIASAYRLLQGESGSAPDATIPSRHTTTLGQDLRSRFSRFLVTDAAGACLATISEAVLVLGQSVGALHEETWVNALSSVALPSGDTWKDPTMPEAFRFEGWERQLAIFRLPQKIRLPVLRTPGELRALAAEHGVAMPNVPFAMLLRGSTVRVYRIDDEGGELWQSAVLMPASISPRVDADHEVLAGRKIAIVGCGSIGSKIGVMLARSGARAFLLVDDDVMLPENLVRHDLDWREVGTHKADSVARRIQLVNPAAACEKRRHRLGGQESSGSVETLIESLAECNLIIDATADPDVFNYAGAAVAHGKAALVWAEVFGGGFGGLVARHRPGYEPAPASMRGMIEAWCADRGQAIPRAATDYGGTEESPMIADDADVTAIAAHAARLAIDTLVARAPSEFPHSVYLIGLSRAWIFDAPFDTYPIDVGGPEETRHQVADPDEAAAELKILTQLFKDYQNAPAPAGSDTEAAQPGAQASAEAGDRRPPDG